MEHYLPEKLCRVCCCGGMGSMCRLIVAGLGFASLFALGLLAVKVPLAGAGLYVIYGVLASFYASITSGRRFASGFAFLALGFLPVYMEALVPVAAHMSDMCPDAIALLQYLPALAAYVASYPIVARRISPCRYESEGYCRSALLVISLSSVYSVLVIGSCMLLVPVYAGLTVYTIIAAAIVAAERLTLVESLEVLLAPLYPMTMLLLAYGLVEAEATHEAALTAGHALLILAHTAAPLAVITVMRVVHRSLAGAGKP